MKIHYENAVFTNMLGIYGSVIHRPLGESYCDHIKRVSHELESSGAWMIRTNNKLKPCQSQSEKTSDRIGSTGPYDYHIMIIPNKYFEIIFPC